MFAVSQDVLVWKAQRRVRPGEELVREDFVSQACHEKDRQQGLCVLTASDWDKKWEATQTLLEGGYLTSYALRRQPDLKRGDWVKVQVRTGGVTLTTVGRLQQPAYYDELVKVLAGQQKKEVSGILNPDHVVSVDL